MKFLRYLSDQRLWVGGSLIALTLVLTLWTLSMKLLPAASDLSVILYALVLAIVTLAITSVWDFTRTSRFQDNLKQIRKTAHDLSDFMITTEPLTQWQREVELLVKQLSRVSMNEVRAQYDTQQFHIAVMSQWAHAMKSPLSVLRLLTDRLSVDIAKEPDPTWLYRITTLHDQLAREVDRMLYALRVEHIEVDARLEPIELVSFIREVINENKQYFISSMVYPRLDAQSEVVVQTDRKWLRFMISQFLDNAIKYSQPSALCSSSPRTPSVTISVTHDSAQATMRIADQGVGIVAQDVNRVWEPFFTGQNGRTFPESTGLGLYLCRRAADALHLTLGIDSVYGQGTVIEWTIPLDATYTQVARSVTSL